MIWVVPITFDQRWNHCFFTWRHWKPTKTEKPLKSDHKCWWQGDVGSLCYCQKIENVRDKNGRNISSPTSVTDIDVADSYRMKKISQIRQIPNKVQCIWTITTETWCRDDILKKYFVAINNFLLVLLVLPATGNRLRRPNRKDTLTIIQ